MAFAGTVRERTEPQRYLFSAYSAASWGPFPFGDRVRSSNLLNSNLLSALQCVLRLNVLHCCKDHGTSLFTGHQASSPTLCL